MTFTPEGLVLDGLDLNDGLYALEEFDPGIARKRPEWVQGDSDGAALVRDPLHENATSTAKVRILASTMDGAVAAIKTLVAKLEEAERQQDGLPLAWTPAGASTSGTGYVLTGELTDMPINPSDGWFVSKPILTVQLTRRPFWYLPEVAGPIITGSAPAITVDVPAVGGDVPAEARLVITERSGQARRHLEWGLEQRFYTPGSPSPVLIDSDDLATGGFAGRQATHAGAYRRAGASNDVVAASLFAQPVAVCGTGNLSHVGTFRVKARVWASSADVQVRLSWQDGDGPFGSNDYVTPPVSGAFCEVDLGVINVQPARAGAQRWTGRVEALAASVGDAIEIDYLVLIPAGEGYGKVRAVHARLPGAVVAYDEFPGRAAAALNGQAATSGGAWATSGSATDFTTSGGGAAQRSTTSDTGNGRLAVLGSTSWTDVAVSVDIDIAVAEAFQNLGALIRYVDANNYAFAWLGTPDLVVEVWAFVGGRLALLGTSGGGVVGAKTIELLAFASGRVIANVLDAAGATVTSVDKSSAALAAGGALATGKAGLIDRGDVLAGVRSYRAFRISTPSPEQIALYANRALEVRSDDTIRQDATGTYYGRVPFYRGSRLLLPPAGDEGRTSRIVAKADRNDLEVAEHAPLGDSISIQPFWTPRCLVVP